MVKTLCYCLYNLILGTSEKNVKLRICEQIKNLKDKFEIRHPQFEIVKVLSA
jgi:hypothetical protein